MHTRHPLTSNALTGIAHRLRRMFRGDTQRAGYGQLPDASPDEKALIDQVRPYTMTSAERLYALIQATRYVVARNIPGALAECGVWKGGSVLAMLKTLQSLGVTDRDVYLYDTFEGMTEPSERDVSPFSESAASTWENARRSSSRAWNRLFSPEQFNIDAVRSVVTSAGYPVERLHFIQGDVTATIPGEAPEALALLRLDTDWYESTRHELQHLYPRLQSGGVLIIDDYGHWHGCRDAVDEYFAARDVTPVLLQRIDYTGRLVLKP